MRARRCNMIALARLRMPTTPPRTYRFVGRHSGIDEFDSYIVGLSIHVYGAMSGIAVVRPRPSCAHCGMPIPAGKPINTRYCQPTCRVAASKARRSPPQPTTPRTPANRPDTPATVPAQRQIYWRLRLKIALWDQVKLGLLCLTCAAWWLPWYRPRSCS